MIKYKECPMCHQSLVDLSNNPAFVNHNPDPPNDGRVRCRKHGTIIETGRSPEEDKLCPDCIKEARNEHTRANRSRPSDLGGVPPSNGHSSIPTMDESTRKDGGGGKSIPDVVSKLNFPISERNIPQEGNLRKDKESKDSKKKKIWIGIGEGFG